MELKLSLFVVKYVKCLPLNHHTHFSGGGFGVTDWYNLAHCPIANLPKTCKAP